jgi:hypothetical protein
VTIASGAIGCRQWPGQALEPAVEKRLHLSRAECVRQLLQSTRVGAPPEAVVQALEADGLFAQLLLEPLVAVQADPDRIRQTRPDLDERRSPFGVLQVEVVVLDGNRLAREREVDGAGRRDVLGRFEGPLALLRHADEHHAFGGPELSALLRGHVVLTLAALELKDGHLLLLGEGGDGLDEAVVQRADGGGRRDLVAEVVAQEGTHLATRLEPGHVAVQIQPVDTRVRQRHVVAQYGGNAGARHRRRLPFGKDQHADGATPALLPTRQFETKFR